MTPEPNRPQGLPTIVVVGLGPGRPGLLTAEVIDAIEATPVRWLRTTKHPSAGVVQGAHSFDYLYQEAGSLEEVYSGIAQALVRSARATGRVLYAVPGSPLVAERSVELLREDPTVQVVLHSGVSFLDLAFERLGVDPLAQGVRLVDGQRFASEAAGCPGPFLVGQCDSLKVMSEVKLAIGAVVDHLAEPVEVPALAVLQRLGLEDERVTVLAWDELDRGLVPDHLTCVWVPRLSTAFSSEMVQLEELARALREKCPWDRRQTHESLTRYLLEESYEALEAIEELGPDGAGYAHLEEELGDVLFQVVFHSILAAEEGQFTLSDVVRHVHEKLVVRHPHVFGDVEATTPEDVARNWEQIKRREKGQPGLMDDVPANLPALLYAAKIQGKAASVGFDWDGPQGPFDKVDEELSELREATVSECHPDEGGRWGARARDELGDLLFSVVNAARHLKVDPEAALREAAAKFRRRFQLVEELARKRGSDLVGLRIEEIDLLWDEVKSSEPPL